MLRDQRHVRDALQQVVSARPGETKEAHAQRLQRDYRSMQVALSGAH